jgi:hypothetical protein
MVEGLAPVEPVVSEGEGVPQTPSTAFVKAAAVTSTQMSREDFNPAKRAADASTYDYNQKFPFELLGNGLGATIWPDRTKGLDKLYNDLKMSAARLWIDYTPKKASDGGPFVPECMGMPPVTLDIMNAYWAEFNGELAERAKSAANVAKGFGADVLIVIKAPPEDWTNLLFGDDGKRKGATLKEGCEMAVALFWVAAVNKFNEIGIPFSAIELFNEPR